MNRNEINDGLLVCKGPGITKNIGDFIQSVATNQFIKKRDCYVERESCDLFKSDNPTKVVMNGWFMLAPQHFPPSEDIIPLYTSFHITPNKAKDILTEKTISHLKKHEPIGARDTYTRDLLLAKGIESYFSGCVTLTLNYKYKSNVHNDSVYFVDPYYKSYRIDGKLKIIPLINTLFYTLIHLRNILNVINFIPEFRTRISKVSSKFENILMCGCFYKTYSKIFSEDILNNAIFIEHRVPQSLFQSNDDRMNYAEDLIKKYSKAKLVVTSRIHCALPCLGVETPVIFTYSDEMISGKLRGAGRFGGLMELLRCIRIDGTSNKIEDVAIKDYIEENGKVEANYNIDNKADYKILRDKLINQIKKFHND